MKLITAIGLGLVVAAAGSFAALARPMGGGGFGGPGSGAGARPGYGWGAPGAGLTRAPEASAWNPAWGRQGGYWSSRTWRTGWYQTYPAAWPWWGASSVAWGVGSLATAAAITSAVDAATYQQSTLIVVPQTSLQLDYGSVQALPPSRVQFAYGVAGMPLMTATSDCKQGLINGMAPTTADQAQVLNASCHIAYGSN
jgi:hypothetical protein